MVAWAPDPARPMRGRVHVDGHDTEFAAANAAKEPRGQQRLSVLERLREVGPRGSTDFEMYEALGFRRPHIPATRREELQNDGWPIFDSGERRPTDTGRNAIVWVLREAGATASPPASQNASDEAQGTPTGSPPVCVDDTTAGTAGPHDLPSSAVPAQLSIALPSSAVKPREAA